MKKIAFTCSSEDKKIFMYNRYIDLLKISPLSEKVVPVILPNVYERGITKEYASCFDGFIFTGGGDIEPEIYKEKKHEKCGIADMARDSFEIMLFKEVQSLGKPILGICRGIQIMSVAMGGSLWQDIPSQIGKQVNHTREHPTDYPTHTVFLTGYMNEIIGKNAITVNSFHHQSVKTPGHRMNIGAKSEDGIIEAITCANCKFCVGVQWHPEINPDDVSLKLINSFLLSV